MWLAVIVLALRSAVISAVLSTSSVMNSWRALPACRASVVRLCAAHESSSEKGKRARCRYESRTVVSSDSTQQESHTGARSPSITDTCCGTLPTSSSPCMIFLMRPCSRFTKRVGALPSFCGDRSWARRQELQGMTQASAP